MRTGCVEPAAHILQWEACPCWSCRWRPAKRKKHAFWMNPTSFCYAVELFPRLWPWRCGSCFTRSAPETFDMSIYSQRSCSLQSTWMLQCVHHAIHWLSLVLACCFQIWLCTRIIKDFNFVTLLLFTSYWVFYTHGPVTKLPVFRSCRGCISLQFQQQANWTKFGPKRFVFVTNMGQLSINTDTGVLRFIFFSSVGQSITTSKLWLSCVLSWCPECPGEIFRMIGGKIKAHLTFLTIKRNSCTTKILSHCNL